MVIDLTEVLFAFLKTKYFRLIFFTLLFIGLMYPNSTSLPVIEFTEEGKVNFEDNNNNSTTSIQKKDLSRGVYLPYHTFNQVSEFTSHSLTNQLSIMDLSALSQFEGVSLKIGIIDNGILTTHNSFSHLSIIQEDFNQNNPIGSNSHGTAVASVISGYYNDQKIGAATGVTIFSARMGTPANNPNAVVGDFIGAMQWLIENNVTLINISLSGSAIPFENLINQADDNNIIIIGSAANNGNNYKHTSGISQHPSAFSIGSINSNLELSYFSSFGYGEYYNDKVDFVMQGESVLLASGTSNSQYYYGSGTSFAAPLFAGGMALFLQYLKTFNISYTSNQLKSLFAVSSRVPNIGQGLEMGYGLVNFSKAVEIFNNEGFQQISNLNTTLPYGMRSDHLRGSTDVIDLYVYSGITLHSLSYTLEGNISQIVTVSSIETDHIKVKISSTSQNDFGVYSGSLIINNTLYSISKSLRVEMSKDKLSDILLHMKYTTSHYDFINRLDGHNLGEFYKLIWNLGYHIEEGFLPFSQSNLSKYEFVILPSFLENYYFNDFYGNVHSINDTDLQHLTDYLSDGGKVFLQTYTNLVDSFSNMNPYGISGSHKLESFLNDFDLSISDPYSLTQEIGHEEFSSNGVNPTGIQTPLLNSFNTNVTNIRHFGGYISYNTFDPNIIIHARNENIMDNLATLVSKSIGNGTLIVSSSDYFIDNCRLRSDRSQVSRSYLSCVDTYPTVSEVDKHRYFVENLFQSIPSKYDYLTNITLTGNQLNIHTSTLSSISISVDGITRSSFETSIHNFELSIAGKYLITISQNDKIYYRELIFDQTTPVATINGDWNWMRSSDDLSSIIKFTIYDFSITEWVLLVNSSLHSSGEAYPSEINDTLPYTIVLETTDFWLGTINFTLLLTDDFNNSATIIFLFLILEYVPDSPLGSDDISNNPVDQTPSNPTSTEINSLFIDQTEDLDYETISKILTLGFVVFLILCGAVFLRRVSL